MNDKNYDLIKFEDGDFSLDVNVSPSEDTVWLNRQEMSLLFERDVKTISKHINNSLNEECKNSTVAKFAIVQKEVERYVEREIFYYNLDVNVSPSEDTVWLTQAQMAELYGVDRTRITRHINNILNDEELEFSSNVRKTHFPNSDKPVNIYNLDMILAVGYRVNSKRGILFIRLANSILKHYLLKGYVINESR